MSFRNADGSISTVTECFIKGDTETGNDFIQMCTECQVITELPEDRFVCLL